MAKRTARGKSRSIRNRGKPIRANRPGFRKKVIGHTSGIKYIRRVNKIKGKEYERV